ncbi:MAG: formylglycine-generating enzyme family protein [Nitrospinaceae bacterium]
MKQLIFLLGIILSLIGSPSFASENPPDGMVRVAGGCFMMGTNKVFYYELGRENIRERPAHRVCLDSFYLDKYEITQKQWEAVMGYNNSAFKGLDLPVTHIRWKEAVEYCSRLGGRLPTEAEWEYAARAGSQADNPWGNGINREFLWYAKNSARHVSSVGKKKPNAWGLYDMMGNVWEWVSDWFAEDYYKKSPMKNPKGPRTRQSWHVIRGGSWVDEDNLIRVTVRYRGMADPTDTFWVGARCALSPPEKKK